ncbi:MAG: hypothetical protein LBV08_05635, partial [Clostridiales bacterium]|nr:hypothetical protein [Clostridiales bacterium]
RQVVGNSIIEINNGLCTIFIWSNALQKNTNYEVYFCFKNQSPAICITSFLFDGAAKSEIRHKFDITEFDGAAVGFDAVVIFDVDNNKIKLTGYRKKYFYIPGPFNVINKKSYYKAEPSEGIGFKVSPAIKKPAGINEAPEEVLNKTIIAPDGKPGEENNVAERELGYIGGEPIEAPGPIKWAYESADATKNEGSIIEAASLQEEKLSVAVKGPQLEAVPFGPGPISKTPNTFSKYIAEYAEQLKGIDKKTFKEFKSDKSILFEKLNLMTINNTQMNPFERQNRNVYWVRVNIRDIEYLFFMKDTERKKVINDQFRKFRHLILGHVKDYSGENYYFGVPFIYNKSQRGYFLKLGFCQFKCCDFARPSEGGYGYWLIKL